MARPNQVNTSHEYEGHDIEAFLPLEGMKHMTQLTLLGTGRIDERGVVQPIEVRRRLHGDQWLMGPETDSIWRDDIFVPTPEETKKYIETNEQGLATKNQVFCLNMGSVLYNRLTGREKVSLTYRQAEGAHLAARQLEATLTDTPGYTWEFSREQLEDAYHVNATEKPETDFVETRIYTPAGINALEVANAVFQAGADMSYAKIWSPRPTTGEQTIRHDAPIFGVTTHDQLYSVINALRNLAAESKLPAGPIPMVGYEVEGLPGVYLGQTHSHSSFNRRMEKLFGEPIKQASSAVKLHAGDVVDDATLANIAAHARELARSKATSTGTDVHNHAFLEGQPVEDILETIRQA